VLVKQLLLIRCLLCPSKYKILVKMVACMLTWTRALTCSTEQEWYAMRSTLYWQRCLMHGRIPLSVSRDWKAKQTACSKLDPDRGLTS
jgi:hypothetical protein